MEGANVPFGLRILPWAPTYHTQYNNFYSLHLTFTATSRKNINTKIKTGGKISKMTKTNKTLLCVLLALVMTFALAFTALTITAQTATAEGEMAVKTLDFSKTKCDSKTSSYTSKTTATVDGFVWSIENFNNNNLGWTYIKCGSKNAASVASIATDAPISEVIEKVVLTIDNVTANNVNSIKLTVASDKDFTTDTQTVDIPAVAIGAQTFTVANPIENGYYKIEIDCKKSSNGIVQISKVEYFAPAAPACDHSADKLTKTEAKAATCTEAGNVEYYTCTCGKIFADSAATTELTETAIPALGHTFGEWVFNNVAHTATRECSVCHTIETKDNTAITIFVNGEKLLPDGTDLTIRKATIEMGSEVLEISTLSENGQIYQGEGFYATFVTSRADKFDHANYTVTVEGGTLVWDESSTDSATITVADNALEVNITVVYNCPHTTKTYTRIAGTETHKVVCPECGATLVESEACVATGENVATCMKEGKCDLCGGAIAKLAHGSEGCTHTAEEILVLNAYDMEASSKPAADAQDVTITGVVYSTYSSSSNKLVITVGSLGEEYKVTLFRPADNDKLPLANLKVGNVITVTGKLFKYKDNTIQFSAGSTYTNVVASKFEVSQSIAAGDGSKEVTDETSGAKTIYVKNGSQIVVTYAITANDGINTFIATLKYNKALFSIVSVTITDGFGAGTAVKSGNVGVTDYKVYIEGDGEGYTANYKGEFVTVVYQFNGDATATIDASEFGLMDVTCYTNHASGFVDADTTIGTSAETFDFIKQASITLNDKAADSQLEVTYNANALTVDLELNNPTLIVKSESTGKLVSKWYSDAAREKEIAAPVNVGTYYLTVTIEATPAYEQSTANFTIVVNPYQIDYDALSVSANPNDKALVGGTAIWAESDIVVGGLASLPNATGVYTITYGTLSFDTVGEKEISVIVTITNANYKFVSANGFATGDSETVYNGKATVSVSAKAISLSLPTLADKYYDGVAISLAGIAASVDGESLTVSVEVTVNGVVLTNEQLATYIANAGTYNIAVRAWVEGNDNYKQVTGNLSVTISKLTLFIDASKIVYNGSIVTWEAVTKAYKANETELVDIADLGVTVTYQVTNGEGHDYNGNNSFDANTLQTVAQLTLKAIPTDTTNFNAGSQGLKMVYQVLFAASSEPAVAESKVNVFEGQVVAAPSVSAEGYRFDAWYNGEEAYNFATPVETNITLVAKWVKQITITWFGEDGTSVLKTVVADVNTKAKFDLETPTKAATDYIDYAFAKWVDTATTKLYDLENEFTLAADISVKATFTGTVARMSVFYKVVDGKGNAGAEVELGRNSVGATDIGLPALENYKWFKVSAWMNGETEFSKVEADELNGEHKIVLVATYSFNVGLGDVDGSGTVDPSDIVLYRKHIVGGYDITPVTDAWTTATAEGFVESKVYFLAQVANVDEDGSDTKDVRDVSTIRMALVGAYGYTIKNGAVIKGSDATAQSAKVQYKQVLAPMGLFGKKFAL